MPTQIEIRQQIVINIVDALKNSDLPPWRMPWATHSNGRGLPANAISKRAYSGINPLLLTLHARRHRFRSRYWATFRQWADRGASVMPRPADVPPGAWGCQIVLFKPITKTEIDKKTGEERERAFPILRTFTVFNADQVYGAEEFQVTDLIVNDNFVGYEPAETALSAYPADVRHGGDQAYYNLTHDYIQLPEKHRFAEEREYYATAFHEAAHHSESRLGWSGSYALGELRSEMAACFLMAELGLPQSEDLTNHHAYIKDWLEALESDPRHLFSASSAASKAVDYILSFSRQTEAETQDVPDEELVVA
ncbi:MAG TPA: zincin-like metallopeptidase domain-containing protein [Isosphaeraceae bacterium]|nr:zincin-like metallopeptidase domain-containing protein [Isosphaeraceae bacterium]